MRDVVIVDGARSAFTKFGGSLKAYASVDIATLVVNDLLKRTGILDKGKVDSLMAGCALGDMKTKDIARYIVLQSELPMETSGTFVEMQGGSAIAGLNHAAWKIKAGMSEVAIVGGMESYSTFTAKFPMCRPQYKFIAPYALKPEHTPNKERDLDRASLDDKMAAEWGITREQADTYAARSQERLAQAYKKGITGDEIVPIVIPATRKTPEIVINKDDSPCPDITAEELSKLQPVNQSGITTTGNSTGLNDGAAFMLVMTAEKAQELGYRPIARWVTGAHCGVREDYTGIAPAYSNLKAIKQAGLKLEDIDVIECNEVSAAENLAVISEMKKQTGKKIDQEKWNPNGGAIAIGNPNAASGARMTMFAMRQLEQTSGKYGMASTCCAGGQGATVIIENLRH